MAVPTSKDDIQVFRPPSLKNLGQDISFRLRPATPRDMRRFRTALAEEGLVSHGKEDIRELILAELQHFWSEDDFNRCAEILRGVWASLDQNLEVDPKIAADTAALTDRLVEASPKLRRALAQTGKFNDDMPKVALAGYLTGYSGLAVPFRMEGGMVPLETIDAIETELEAIETRAIADKVEGVKPGTAYAELAMESFKLLGLTDAERKNSERPAPSSSTPNGSSTDGQASQEDGSSEKTSGPKTPDEPSPKTTS